MAINPAQCIGECLNVGLNVGFNVGFNLELKLGLQEYPWMDNNRVDSTGFN